MALVLLFYGTMSRERACILIGWVHSQGQTISRIYQGAIVLAPISVVAWQLHKGRITSSRKYHVHKIPWGKLQFITFPKAKDFLPPLPLPPFVNLYFPHHKSAVWNMHMVCFFVLFPVSLAGQYHILSSISLVLYSVCGNVLSKII